MNSTAVKYLCWGVLERVKCKTHDERTLVGDERVSVCVCVKEGLTEWLTEWLMGRE